jgi:hypothetical protein
VRINDAATAIEEWAVATVADLQGSYDYAAAEKTQPLPDCSAEVASVEIGIDPRFFPREARLEQADFRTLTFDLILVTAPEPAREASRWLGDAADDLSEALRSDDTLGGRVNRASKRHAWSFKPPFVRFDDNTEGRQATMTLALAEEV